MFFIIFSKTKYSGAIATGLKSLGCLGDQFFGTGIMIEDFHKSGT